MKFFVNFLLPGLFLSLANASVIETLFQVPFIRCYSPSAPAKNIVALYAYSEGVAGMVVAGHDYLVDKRLKSTPWGRNLRLLQEPQLVSKGPDGVEKMKFSDGDKWNVVINLFTAEKYSTQLNIEKKVIPLTCEFWNRN